MQRKKKETFQINRLTLERWVYTDNEKIEDEC